MSQMTNFKDALDYIFITNDSGPNSYLISSDNAAAQRVTSAISGGGGTSSAISPISATPSALLMAGRTPALMGSDAFEPTAASDMAAAAAAMVTDLSAAAMALAADNLYSGVAVGLGAMLINDTLLLDMNGTTALEDLYANGSDLMLLGNGTGAGNATGGEDDFGELVKMAATSVVLGLMILITIIGNVFVIAAIILERNLQNVANYLVASLAVADLFVACLVMPLGAVYEISQGWILGPELCDIWTSCDVLCCTASILHLVAIAVDRYWAVTNIDYMHSRTSKRVFLMIFFVWFASVIVSLAPQFGWKDADYLQRIEQQKCMVSQDVAYQVFATCCTFYVPLLVILVLYWKIYQTARKRIHRRRPKPINVTANNNQPDAVAQKKRKRLRLRLGKFSSGGSKTLSVASHPAAGSVAGTTALGLVEGNSTNTVNTVEDTEFSSSNVDSKSRAGVEVTTTAFSNAEEVPTTSVSQINTVSHLVALANQQLQQASANSNSTTATQSTAATTTLPQATVTHPLQQQSASVELLNEKTTPTDHASPPHSKSVSIAKTTANGNGGDVLEDPQLQQQLAQVQQQVGADVTGILKQNTQGGQSASNATTITSISALSPQTPTSATILAALPNNAAAPHPILAGSNNASSQVTPIPKPKNQQQLSSIANPMQRVTKRKETLEAKRERKAAKTLAIITGAFVICWLPFFVMALMMPLCEACEINDSIASLFLWLGYFNSTLNPVIYTIFSPEFRQAFKRILFGGHRPVHYRSGKI